jgi:hypothetical protein
MYTVKTGSNPVLTSKLNNMKNQFTPYEDALELKELGFDEECLAYYHQDQMLEVDSLGIKRDHYRGKFGVLAPLYQQAFRWFREKYGLDSYTYYDKVIKFYTYFICEEGVEELYDTYEESELACLKKLIEIVKGKEVAINCHTYN